MVSQIRNDVTNCYGNPGFQVLGKSAAKSQYFTIFDEIFKYRPLEGRPRPEMTSTIDSATTISL
jgi:hypothetical protein